MGWGLLTDTTDGFPLFCIEALNVISSSFECKWIVAKICKHRERYGGGDGGSEAASDPNLICGCCGGGSSIH